MYKCIHNPKYHTQTPKIPRTFIYEPVWQSSNHHVQTFAKLAKHLEKYLMPHSGVTLTLDVYGSRVPAK